MSVVINDVSKNFDNGICALENIDMHIDNGVFGIIGYNSSGKSTLLKIITTLVEPSKGSIKIFGKDVKTEKRKNINNMFGYLPQNFSFYDNYTIDEFMNYMAKIYGINKIERKNVIKNILKDVSLYEKKSLKFSELTTGMKRRVGLAQAMLNRPRVLVVDDPIQDIENEEKRIIKEVLNRYGKDNIVIISTRSASDLEGITTKMAVMHKGKMCFNGSSEELIKNASGNVWLSNVGEFLDVARLKGIHKVVSFIKVENDYYARVISDVKPYKESKKVKATLEDAFLYCVCNS